MPRTATHGARCRSVRHHVGILAAPVPHEFLAFDPAVMSAATNPSLSNVQHFAVQRIADLLAPRAPFSQAASSVVDPLTLIRELGKTREEFLKDDGMRWPEMISALKNVRTLVGLERNLTPLSAPGAPAPVGWFHREWQRVTQEIAVALHIPSNSQKDEIRRDLAHALGRTFARLLAAFEVVLAHSQTGYAARLLAQVIARCAANPTVHDTEWLNLDRDLQNLLATQLSMGHSGYHFALALATSLDSASDSADALDRLRAAFLASPKQYTVALTIVGAKNVDDAVMFGCAPLSPNPQWPTGTGSHNGALGVFVARTSHGRRARTFLVDVTAFDAGHAYAQAGSAAENLLDQLCANHRGRDFELHPEGLAYEHVAETITELSRPAGLIRAGILTSSSAAKLQNSLAFHTQARTTHNPMQVVINSWVALEALGADARVRRPVPNQRPVTTRKPRSVGHFLPPTTAAALALAAVRNQLTGTWRLAQRGGATSPDQHRWGNVESYLGVVPGADIVDLNRWKELVVLDPVGHPTPTGTPTSDLDAAALMHDVLGATYPYVAWRLREAGRMLRDQDQLVQWADEVRLRAHVNVDRIHSLRNRVIHDAVRATGGAQQLAEVALNTLDALYEVLAQGWMASGQDLWIALDDIWRRQNQRFQAWTEPAATRLPVRPYEIVAK